MWQVLAADRRASPAGPPNLTYLRREGRPTRGPAEGGAPCLALGCPAPAGAGSSARCAASVAASAMAHFGADLGGVVLHRCASVLKDVSWSLSWRPCLAAARRSRWKSWIAPGARCAARAFGGVDCCLFVGACLRPCACWRCVGLKLLQLFAISEGLSTAWSCFFHVHGLCYRSRS